MGLYDYTIYSVIKRNAEVYGDRIGWIIGEQKLTHHQFAEAVNRVAAGLLNAGIKKGDRISTIAQNSLSFFYLLGAAAKIGAIMLPINWRLGKEEIEYVLRDGSPKLLFVGTDYIELIDSLRSRLGFVERFYSMDKASADYESLQSLFEAELIEPSWDVHSEDAVTIIYTAAVAGKPRGAILSHRGLIAANLECIRAWRLTEEDCHLCVLPLFHVGGLLPSLNVMHAGGKNTILPKFDPDQVLRHIQGDRVTIFIEFSPMLQTLLNRNQELKCSLTSLRVVSGLDKSDVIKKFEEQTGGTFWAAYGQTETCNAITFAPYFERMGSAGLPGLLCEVKIVDEYGNFLDPPQKGEIVVRGPQVFNGYWNLKEDNTYAFRNGWYHTGDKGHLDKDGYLWYVGRLPEKELIKTGGENVYPVEVEKAILEHPAVKEVSVIGVQDEQWGEGIKAVCVLEKGETMTGAELIAFVASKIGRYKKPKYVTFVTDLPKTEGGSIDRETVKARFGKV